jgi:hypothetical protein
MAVVIVNMALGPWLKWLALDKRSSLFVVFKHRNKEKMFSTSRLGGFQQDRCRIIETLARDEGWPTFLFAVKM